MKTLRDLEEHRGIVPPKIASLMFSSQDFRVIRLFLRLLSLWRPQSAGFFESYVYPISVNLLLILSVGIIRDVIIATKIPTFLSVQVVFLVNEGVLWLGHILANHYFVSRDLETNVLRPAKPLTEIVKLMNRRIKVLNAVMVISMLLFSIMLCALFVGTGWNNSAERFSAQLPHVHGPLDHILYCLVLLSIVYQVGIGLALSWTLALLYNCYAARLEILEIIFTKWKQSSADAVSSFIQAYARPVRNSWERLSWWFLAHNVVALAIPLYGYGLAQAVSGSKYHWKHLPQFFCYFVFIVTIWLAPIVIGELIKGRERKFLERINDISPWLLEVENGSSPLAEVHFLGKRRGLSLPIATANDLPHHLRQASSIECIGSTSTTASESGTKHAEYTFASRGKELRNFLRFLKRRTPGLVSRGYSLQLNVSVISLIGGAISFLIELHTINSENGMYRHCNCTMS